MEGCTCINSSTYAKNLLILLHCKRKTAIQHSLWHVAHKGRDFSTEAEMLSLSSMSNTLGSDKKCAMSHTVMTNFCN